MQVVLLMAGKSERLGVPKGLKRIAGDYWLNWQLKHLKSVGVTQVVLVTGYHLQVYQSHFRSLSSTQLNLFHVPIRHISNPEPERGAFSSLQIGLNEALRSSYDFTFILPIDVPAANSETWSSLSLYISDYDCVVPAFGGRGGHPVCLSKKFSNYLLNLDAKVARLDFEIKKLSSQKVKHLSLDDKNVTLNLNTLEDFELFESENNEFFVEQ